MPRQRGQAGQLTCARKFWSGRFYLYEKRARGGEAVIRKTVRVGPVSELSRDEAATKLRQIIIDEQARRDHLAFVGITPTGPLQELGTRQKGMVAEMLVAMDLTRKGFEVFRHMSDLAPCDMIIMREDSLLRVEVKYAGSWKGVPLRRYVNCAGRFDILAVVSPDQTVEYIRADGENLSSVWALTEHPPETGDSRESVGQTVTSYAAIG